MAELATSASPCLWAPSCPSVCATGSAALLLASRAPPRPSFAVVARGHRCRGRCECLCARPGQPGPPLVLMSSPTCLRRPLDAPSQLLRHRRRPPPPEPGAPARCPVSGRMKRPRTTRMNLIVSRGLSDESVTQLNSAKKDPFVRV